MERLKKVANPPRNTFHFYMLSRIQPICDKYNYKLIRHNMFWYEITENNEQILLIKINPRNFNIFVLYEKEFYYFENLTEFIEFIRKTLTERNKANLN